MRRWLPAATFLAIAAAPAGAVESRTGHPATIKGSVTDLESRAPLAGAVVRLVDLSRQVITDDQGRYRIDDVPPGPQHVVARRVGYAPETFHALVPREGFLEIHVALRPVPIRMQPVEVRAPVAVRGLEPPPTAQFPDRALSAESVRQHPMISEPDVLQAASGGEVVVRPESPGGVHVHGGASDHLAYVLDGIPVFSPYHAAGTFGAWNPDALAGLELFTSAVPPALPDALAGAMSARTRAPGPQLQTQGSFSTSQLRTTVDGPLWAKHTGFLLSLRSTFPGLITRRQDSSYIQGESTDWLGKIAAQVLGGQLQLLGTGIWNEIDTSTRAPADTSSGIAAAPEPPRNALSWDSRSFGGEWARSLGPWHLRLLAFSARGNAAATWQTDDSLSDRLTADRHDVGLVIAVETDRDHHRTTVGLRGQRSVTLYDSRPGEVGAVPLKLEATTRVGAAFLEHRRSVSTRGQLGLALAGAFAPGGFYLNPSAQARWHFAPTWSASIVGARRRQFTQSLRNAESIVGNIFPADLSVGTGPNGVPIARSDVAVVALEHRPAPGLRIGVQAYARDFDALALVAPRNDSPFATSGFSEGSGVARGCAVEVGANGARYGALVSYGLQHVRLSVDDLRYAPEPAAAHSIDAGIIVFPSVTSSVRLGLSSALGRRGTLLLGPLEWEACNLVDQGCEFAGGPLTRAGPLGGTRLPAYVRLDLGARKHWHVELAGRDGQLSLFGSLTNLLARKNVLTYAIDPETGQRSEVEMRPLSPLVVGVDWRF